jgi:hypothetical protein
MGELCFAVSRRKYRRCNSRNAREQNSFSSEFVCNRCISTIQDGFGGWYMHFKWAILISRGVNIASERICNEKLVEMYINIPVVQVASISVVFLLFQNSAIALLKLKENNTNKMTGKQSQIASETNVTHIIRCSTSAHHGKFNSFKRLGKIQTEKR